MVLQKHIIVVPCSIITPTVKRHVIWNETENLNTWGMFSSTLACKVARKAGLYIYIFYFLLLFIDSLFFFPIPTLKRLLRWSWEDHVTKLCTFISSCFVKPCKRRYRQNAMCTVTLHQTQSTVKNIKI